MDGDCRPRLRPDRFGEIAEDSLRSVRNSLHWHKASGDIVLVKIDDQALRKSAAGRGRGAIMRQLTDRLTAAGAKRIFFDITFCRRDRRRRRRGLRRGAEAVGPRDPANADRCRDRAAGPNRNRRPLPGLADAARGLGTISWHYNYQNAVTRHSLCGAVANGKIVPSFSSLLSGRAGRAERDLRAGLFGRSANRSPAFRRRTSSTAASIRRLIAGKDVVIGITTEELGDQFFVPGTGRMGGAYVHIIGAETLKAGRPVDLGWIPLFLAALGACAAAATRRDGRPAGADPRLASSRRSDRSGWPRSLPHLPRRDARAVR